MAVTMARMDVAETRWRLPSVPREMDKLPFPTDRIVCGLLLQTRRQYIMSNRPVGCDLKAALVESSYLKELSESSDLYAEVFLRVCLSSTNIQALDVPFSESAKI